MAIQEFLEPKSNPIIVFNICMKKFMEFACKNFENRVTYGNFTF